MYEYLILLFISNLVKRDIPPSSSCHQSETANMSMITTFYDNCNLSLKNGSSSVESTPMSNLSKISTISSTILPSACQNSMSYSVTTFASSNKINKHSSSINQQDTSSLNSYSRTDTNPDLSDKKLLLVSL